MSGRRGRKGKRKQRSDSEPEEAAEAQEPEASVVDLTGEEDETSDRLRPPVAGLTGDDRTGNRDARFPFVQTGQEQDDWVRAQRVRGRNRATSVENHARLLDSLGALPREGLAANWVPPPPDYGPGNVYPGMRDTQGYASDATWADLVTAYRQHSAMEEWLRTHPGATEQEREWAHLRIWRLRTLPAADEDPVPPVLREMDLQQQHTTIVDQDVGTSGSDYRVPSPAVAHQPQGQPDDDELLAMMLETRVVDSTASDGLALSSLLPPDWQPSDSVPWQSDEVGTSASNPILLSPDHVSTVYQHDPPTQQQQQPPVIEIDLTTDSPIPMDQAEDDEESNGYPEIDLDLAGRRRRELDRLPLAYGSPRWEAFWRAPRQSDDEGTAQARASLPPPRLWLAPDRTGATVRQRNKAVSLFNRVNRVLSRMDPYLLTVDRPEDVDPPHMADKVRRTAEELRRGEAYVLYSQAHPGMTDWQVMVAAGLIHLFGRWPLGPPAPPVPSGEVDLSGADATQEQRALASGLPQLAPDDDDQEQGRQMASTVIGQDASSSGEANAPQLFEVDASETLERPGQRPRLEPPGQDATAQEDGQPAVRQHMPVPDLAGRTLSTLAVLAALALERRRHQL
jgi:hypothetical protein